MDEANVDGVSVMIVLTWDCGVLAEAMYFLSRQDLRNRTTLERAQTSISNPYPTRPSGNLPFFTISNLA
ncbi:MAG: hypothetical protein GXP23_10605 [Gammaproteobacteria bacterium]|nr:hypothetical protein [Gammaproteobacteria bacterium]